MTADTASIIVVSYQRPESLRLCLLGLKQLFYDPFEIVLVADPTGLDVAQVLGLNDQIKTVPFTERNISKARNAGLAAAAGQIVAFIDDDAVPEPTWLTYLTEPFVDPKVGAVGGFVRGRNGISFQWKARLVNALGQHENLKVSDTAITVCPPTDGKAVRTEGTNMAFRRSALEKNGGFDPTFRFFLDETDLNMRLTKAGVVTAIAPLAQVHHGYALGPYRRADRVPKSLFEVGSSMATYLQKHAPKDHHARAWADFAAGQRKRLIRHLVSGTIEPRDIAQLMHSLYAGYAHKDTAQKTNPPEITKSTASFLRFTPNAHSHIVLSGRFWKRKKMLNEARLYVEKGHSVSVFLLSPTLLFHKVRFTAPGIWLQTGGIFGKSVRTQKRFQLRTFADRIISEVELISKFRIQR